MASCRPIVQLHNNPLKRSRAPAPEKLPCYGLQRSFLSFKIQTKRIFNLGKLGEACVELLNRAACMRPITPLQISVFSMLFAIILAAGSLSGYLLVGSLSLGDFRGIAVIATIVVCIYFSAFAVYRLFFRLFPLREGEMVAGSLAEFSAQVNILFYLLLFNSLIRTHFLPVPLLRLVYLALGARLGRNTYSAGVLLDPPLTIAGDNCIIGHDAVLIAHAIEGNRFALAPVRLGNNVTIGAHAIVMSGVSVGDGAIVSAGAVVLKGTCIGPGEVWGGVPARCLKSSS